VPARLTWTISPVLRDPVRRKSHLIQRICVPYLCAHSVNVIHSLEYGQSKRLRKSGRPGGPGGNGKDNRAVVIRLMRYKTNTMETKSASNSDGPILSALKLIGLFVEVLAKRLRSLA
jgi:hypothetical protein